MTRLYNTSIKLLSVEPFTIYLSGWGFSDKIVLTEIQKQSFFELGIKDGSWLNVHEGWLKAKVNLRAEKAEDLQFINLEIDDRPTPTDEDFLKLYDKH